MTRKMHSDHWERVEMGAPSTRSESQRLQHDARVQRWVYLLCAFAGGFLLGAMTGRVPL